MPMIEPMDAIGSRPLARALAETINGFHKTEFTRRRNSWRTMDEVEIETPKWVDWFNNRRLLDPLGEMPPAEAEEAFYANSKSRLRRLLSTAAISRNHGLCD